MIMLRSARRHSETGIFHVMLRGINRADLFLEPEDYQRFIEVLRQCKPLCGFELFAWCLMGNHVHLLIRPGREPLSLVMKRVGCRYGYWFNRKYERVGHLFQDRYRSEAVETDAYFLTALRYILQNPIKAGLEAHMGDYPYSSFKAYTGILDGLTDTGFALGYIEDQGRLIEFLTASNNDKALDVEPARTPISDADVLLWADAIVKEIPHNMCSGLTDEFRPSSACKPLDYPPGNLRFLQAEPGQNSSRHTTTQSCGISLRIPEKLPLGSWRSRFNMPVSKG